MTVTLRWTRLVLLSDIALIAVWIIVLMALRLIGANIQPLKWPTMFFGGILTIIAALLAIVVLALQVAIGFRGRSEAK